MSGPEIMAVVGFFVAVSGALWGVWWRVEGRISAAKDRADKVAEDLAAHRLHIAETYVTKAGLQEQTTQIMRAIEGVGSRIDGMNERLDRAFEHPHVTPLPRRRTSSD